MTAAGEVFGCTEPRIFTPPLHDVEDPRWSAGHSVIAFANNVLGIELLPYQEWLYKHMLELNEDGTFRFRTVLIIIARQNGKSLFSIILMLWRIFIDGTELVISTAQNLEQAEYTWWTGVKLARSIPWLESRISRVSRTNGQKLMEVRGRHKGTKNTVVEAEWRVAAANDDGGRGKPPETVLMDELRQHHNWEAWSAAANAAMAQKDALIIGVSNAGDARSVVLISKRDEAIKKLHDPASTLAIFEWSAEPGCDIWDRKAWAQANPSLGYLITTEAMADAAGQPESKYRTENLCQFVDADVDSLIDEQQWAELADPASTIDPASELVVGIDVSADRSYTTFAVAGWREDGLPHVEVITSRAGMGWVGEYAAELAEKWNISSFAVQGRGCGAAELVEPLEAEGLPVRQVVGSMLGAATGQFKDKVRDGQLHHLSQPLLNLAVSGSVGKGLGESQVVSRRDSAVDAAPLIASMWAVYGLEHDEMTDVRLSVYSQMESKWWLDEPALPARAGTTPPAGEPAPAPDTPWWL